jgi:hypothetical protein
MRQADRVLDDDRLLDTVYEALVRRHPKSRTRGRLGTPAEIVDRILLLKHIRNWSFDVAEREVRSNLAYREFTRVGAGKVPDAKALRARHGHWSGGDQTDSSAHGGTCGGKQGCTGSQDACGCDRGRDQHPLS